MNFPSLSLFIDLILKLSWNLLSFFISRIQLQEDEIKKRKDNEGKLWKKTIRERSYRLDGYGLLLKSRSADRSRYDRQPERSLFDRFSQEKKRRFDRSSRPGISHRTNCLFLFWGDRRFSFMFPFLEGSWQLSARSVWSRGLQARSSRAAMSFLHYEKETLTGFASANRSLTRMLAQASLQAQPACHTIPVNSFFLKKKIRENKKKFIKNYYQIII